ncbi:hypothetical protein QFC20_007385 [Naganishia adeliensis]|uniref:Uncharacterized protein n=1 Tax=Naganishia adeliensis TaxID=92952 RepID=A0ACC2UZZ0_9TREE|nr:hypothetical protein QFC20_007385 [Naganishia adeliensis]
MANGKLRDERLTHQRVQHEQALAALEGLKPSAQLRVARAEKPLETRTSTTSKCAFCERSFLTAEDRDKHKTEDHPKGFAKREKKRQKVRKAQQRIITASVGYFQECMISEHQMLQKSGPPAFQGITAPAGAINDPACNDKHQPDASFPPGLDEQTPNINRPTVKKNSIGMSTLNVMQLKPTRPLGCQTDATNNGSLLSEVFRCPKQPSPPSQRTG